MCESICPVDAIRYDDEVEDEETKFIQLNGDPFRTEDGIIEKAGGWYRGSDPIQDPKEIRDMPKPMEREK